MRDLYFCSKLMSAILYGSFRFTLHRIIIIVADLLFWRFLTKMRSLQMIQLNVLINGIHFPRECHAFEISVFTEVHTILIDIRCRE